MFTQHNAGTKNVYAARITGSKGDLYVRIGGADNDWQPSDSSYKDYREYAQGAGWKVWVGLPNNPEFQQAPRRPAFEVPTYKAAESITIPDDWLALVPARKRMPETQSRVVFPASLPGAICGPRGNPFRQGLPYWPAKRDAQQRFDRTPGENVRGELEKCTKESFGHRYFFRTIRGVLSL